MGMAQDTGLSPGVEGAAAPPPGFLAPQHTSRELQHERAMSPPPYREESRYGPLANNPAGDDKFHRDRAAWYRRSTGHELTGTPTEQHALCHELARPFRADNTRSGRSGKAASASASGAGSSTDP